MVVHGQGRLFTMDAKKNSLVFLPVETKPNPSCCNWKKVLLVIGIVLLLILTALGILAYFFWPRGIQVQVISMDMNQAKINIYSKNLVDFTVKNLHVVVLYANTYVLATLEKSDFVIKAQGNTTITLSAQGFNVPPPALGHCERYTHLPLDLNITVDLKLLRWANKKIKTKETVNLDCAVAGNALLDKYRDYF